MAPARAATSTHRALGSERRQDLLRALRASRRPIDADEAGRALGVHRNSARHHLEVLESSGLVRRVIEDRRHRGRPRVLYTLSADGRRRAGALGQGSGYLELARILAAGLGEGELATVIATRAGERWAELVAPRRRRGSRARGVETLTEVLADLGFEPSADPAEGPDCLRLHACPFADVAREHRSVACGVHLGLIQATLARLAPETTVASLEPFATEEPMTCLVRLEPRRPVRRRPREAP